MKKILVVCVAFAASLVFSNNTQAQVKIGVFDDQQILGFMPGINKVDSLMKKFVSDSIQPQYDMTLADYQYKDSILKIDTVKGTLSPSIKKYRIDEVNKLRQTLVNWQQTSQQIYQAKQNEYLAPYIDKIKVAFEEVAKEQKYTLVLRNDAVIIADKSDELPLRVLAKLKIPLPKEVEDQIKALNGGGASAAPATKAPVKH